MNSINDKSTTTIYVILAYDIFLFSTESAKVAWKYQQLGYQVLDFPIVTRPTATNTRANNCCQNYSRRATINTVKKELAIC